MCSPDRIASRNPAHELLQFLTALSLPGAYKHYIHFPRLALCYRKCDRTVNSRIVREWEELDFGIESSYFANIDFTSGKHIIVFRDGRTLQFAPIVPVKAEEVIVINQTYPSSGLFLTADAKVA